jgi:hypothetical protein
VTNSPDNRIKDNLGQWWTFTGQRIIVDEDDSEDGGYICSSLEEGRELLIEYGYLTEESK